MPTTTLSEIPTAPAHSGVTETPPSAVPNSLFSTFPAVPMSSVLASMSAASSSTPTAVPNSLFSTFEAVPMSSFLSSLSSSFPTPIPNSEFSTFPALPMSSVIASLSTAMLTTPSPLIQSSKTSAGQFTSTTSTPTLKCNHDNCFRGALRSEPAVMSFCTTYTDASKSAGTGFPEALLHCNNSPVSISSACSCLASHTSSISSALSISTSYSTTTTSLPANSTTTPSWSSPTIYPTANPTKWISLPASEAVKSCAGM